MNKGNYNLILNAWKIDKEAERWSLKRLFQFEKKKQPTQHNFAKFLEKRYAKPPSK